MLRYSEIINLNIHFHKHNKKSTNIILAGLFYSITQNGFLEFDCKYTIKIVKKLFFKAFGAQN